MFYLAHRDGHGQMNQIIMAKLVCILVMMDSLYLLVDIFMPMYMTMIIVQLLGIYEMVLMNMV